MRISIRRLTPEDLPAYKALRDQVLTAFPQAFTSDPAPERSAESYLSRLGLDRPEGGEFTLGAWTESQLLGAISCERDPRAKVRHIGHLIGMMVRAQAQGMGIGRMLLRGCITQARAATGLSMLTLTVTGGNGPAVHLYESEGFIRYGSLPRAILVDGVYHAKDQMMLTLEA